MVTKRLVLQVKERVDNAVRELSSPNLGPRMAAQIVDYELTRAAEELEYILSIAE